MILWRYLGRVYLGVVCLALAALVTLVVAVTLVENAGILANQATGARTALGLAVFGGVEYAYQILPVACFIGLLAAGCGLAQQGEILAIEAMGWARWRLYAPFAAVTLIVTSWGAGCAETLMPYTVAERGRLQRDEIRHVDPLTQFYQRRSPWFRHENWLLYLPELDRAQVRFGHPVVYGMQQGRITSSIEAEALQHTATGWWLLGAHRESLVLAGREFVPCLHIDLGVSPEDLIDVTGNPRELTVWALRGLIARRSRSGVDITAHSIELNMRLAQPVATFALVLLALPWALDPQRRRTLSSSLGPGIVAVALYMATSQVCRLLALAHKLPPALGAWGAPCLVLLCTPFSMYLYRHRPR